VQVNGPIALIPRLRFVTLGLGAGMRKWNWSRNGAFIGLAISLSDLIEWRGAQFLPWGSPSGLAYNIGSLAGAAAIAALIGLAAGAIKDAHSLGTSGAQIEDVRPMKAETTIVQRLGIAINWLGLSVAAICLLGFLSIVAAGLGFFGGVASTTDAYFFAGVLLILAALSWLSGRTIRYILAGF
jgi:hypothetical protein